MQHHYLFISSWTIGAPRAQLWDMANEIERIDCWKNVVFDKVEHGNGPDGIGDVFRCTFQTKMLFRLSIRLKVVDRRKPNQFTLEVEGPLAGIGTCYMEETEDGRSTFLRCEWKVRLDHGGLRAFNPVLRPIYIWSHDRVMDEGVQGVAASLGATVSDQHHETKVYHANSRQTS